ncbi:ABC transporter permease [Spirillospora sp. NPDC127200]
MTPRDLLSLGLLGLRARKPRAALSALGVAIGIATMIVVTGVPASGHRALMAEMTALGTTLLRADPVAQDPPVTLPPESPAMAARIGPVERVAAVANTHAVVRRSEFVDPEDSSGLAVLAAQPALLEAVGGRVRAGAFLAPGTGRFPVVVLGHEAAVRLGVPDLPPDGPPPQLVIGGGRFTVTGVLAPMPLAPDLERSVLVGWDAARERLGFDGRPTVVYVKAREDALEGVRAALPATLNPELPGIVQVSRPSDALAAKRLAQTAHSGLFLGLAGVALLVGGIGVANTMVISVLERRREIGLRRALGASRRQVRGQFLTESVVLCALGGAAGVLLGAAGTAGYAVLRGWPPVIPVAAVAGGFGGALLVGAVAGVYPAMRAARLPPTEALAAP